MKKSIIYTLILTLFCVSNIFCQDQEEVKSKMLDFTSKTGVIIKFEDYNLDDIKLNYGIVKSRIRKIISGSEEGFFFQISKEGKYGDKVASIAYEDLLELQKALINLKIQSEIDVNSSSDYLENKFITEDGFQVGYYVKKRKVKWYMRLEKYGSDNTVFVNSVFPIEEAFRFGKEKIQVLK